MALPDTSYGNNGLLIGQYRTLRTSLELAVSSGPRIAIAVPASAASETISEGYCARARADR
eukprot:2785665-Rhodomonas_salina.3